MIAPQISQPDNVISKKTEGDEKLLAFRSSIDAIDQQLIQLLTQRCEIVRQVGEYKRETYVDPIYIRPGREADMVRKLIESSRSSLLPDHAIGIIWRQIISACTSLESPVTLQILAEDSQVAERLAREHFGSFSSQTPVATTEAMLSAIDKREAMMGIFPAIHNENPSAPWWWKIARHNAFAATPVYVFLQLPFLKSAWNRDFQAFAAGHILPEPTLSDESLFLITGKTCLAFENPYGLTVLGQWQESAERGHSLVKLAGFQTSLPANSLPESTQSEFLGAYATAIEF